LNEPRVIVICVARASSI